MTKPDYPKTLVEPVDVPTRLPPEAVTPPPISEQRFDEAKFLAQLNQASQARLEERKAVAELDAQLGYVPLMQVLGSIEGERTHVWPKLKLLLQRRKAKATCRVEWPDGAREHRDLDPAWLECLPRSDESPGFSQPDGGVLWFDQAIAHKNHMKAPVRISDIKIEADSIEALRPKVTQAPPSAARTMTLKPPPRRGRSPGDGAKNDDAALKHMRSLLADGTAASRTEAAKKAIVDLGLQEFSKNAYRRLEGKFTSRYGVRAQGETWKDMCANAL